MMPMGFHAPTPANRALLLTDPTTIINDISWAQSAGNDKEYVPALYVCAYLGETDWDAFWAMWKEMDRQTRADICINIRAELRAARKLW